MKYNKNLSDKLQQLIILIVGVLIILFGMSKSNNKSDKVIFERLIELKEIIVNRDNDYLHQFQIKLKEKCQKAIKEKTDLNKADIKFCEKILNN